MATKRPGSGDLYDDLMTCPVCKDDFEDPRLLDCGHHFCFGCLEKISKGNSGGSICCPTCRHITKKNAEDLKKYKCNEFTAKVSMFMSKKRARIEKLCGLCDKSTLATLTCKECQANFCDTCNQTHKKLEQISGHKATPISEFIFCDEHPDKFVNCICQTCDKFLCLRCMTQHDGTHNLSDIKEAATKAKERLKTVLLTKESLQKDKVLSKYVEEAMIKLRNENGCADKYITEIENNIAILQTKVKEFKKRKDEAFQKELKELEILKNDAAEFIQTKESLIQHVNDLLDSASDCEIISREKEFPKYASDSVRSVFTKFTVEFPKVKELQSVAQQLHSMKKQLEFNSHSESIIIKEESLQPMEVRTTFNICSGDVTDLAYNPSNDTYVVRSNDAEKLIQVFDVSGKKIRTFGSKKKRIDHQGQIAIDTRRELYLLPTIDGKIVCINYEGKEEKVISVRSVRLAGISYCTIPDTGKDRYIVSSARYADEEEEVSHSIYIIDAEDGTVLKEIKKEASVFSPYSVSAFSSSKSGVRVLAGYYRGHARVFDLQGKLCSVIKVPQEEKPKVQSVCCDLRPGILVCNENQNAILYYGYEDNKETLDDPKVLFMMADIREQELSFLEMIAFDWKRRRILLMCRGANDKVFVLEEKRE